MAESDRRRWNERYAAGAGDAPPLPRLLQLAGLLRPTDGLRRAGAPGSLGRSNEPAGAPPHALDLACGAGRHTLMLAEWGYLVDAWDVSEVALARLRAAAAARGLAERVRPVQINLDHIRLPVGHYTLVLDTYFLDRRLFPAMRAALAPRGLLFLETLL